MGAVLGRALSVPTLAGDLRGRSRSRRSFRDIGQRPATVKVVVATTVMLSFISFWRAAAIVLSDLASSAYYVGGIAEQAIGKAAPWFILAIMLFSYAVRAIYIESCSHVRARRRVQGGARGHGRHAGQVLRLRPDVRLRAHRPHQRASARACTWAA